MKCWTLDDMDSNSNIIILELMPFKIPSIFKISHISILFQLEVNLESRAKVHVAWYVLCQVLCQFDGSCYVSPVIF